MTGPAQMMTMIEYRDISLTDREFIEAIKQICCSNISSELTGELLAFILACVHRRDHPVPPVVVSAGSCIRLK
jgi:hypothetical protein